MMPIHRVRTISKGKSAQFPMTGKFRSASYHTPGNEITPSTTKQAERIVSIDDLLINAQFIPNIDEAMTHYDIRSIYTQEAGYALAKVADQNILRTAIKSGLCDNANVAGTSGMIQQFDAFDDEDFTDNVFIGGVTSSPAADVQDPKELAQAIIEAKRILENKAVPGDPVVVLPTDLYFNMFKVNGTTPLNDLIIFNRDVGGTGSPLSGNVPSIMGMPLVVTPHLGSFSGSTFTSNLFTQAGGAGTALATTDADPLSGESGRNGQYDVPATSVATGSMGTDNLSDLALRVVGMVMTQDAVATVKLMDLSVESEYQIIRQGTLTVSKYAMGHNVLRPAACVLLLQGTG
tara:strand:- start:2273 stop:3313 length:1041 start_codon:yes stop_codon:yes gene_type:complete